MYAIHATVLIESQPVRCRVNLHVLDVHSHLPRGHLTCGCGCHGVGHLTPAPCGCCTEMAGNCLRGHAVLDMVERAVHALLPMAGVQHGTAYTGW